MSSDLVSIIVPTYNESENILGLISAIESQLQNAGQLEYEIVVMDDDSPDGTARLVNSLQSRRVRGVNRRGRQRGLSRSVVDGFKEARGGILVVMDADGSHPPSAVPSLVRAVRGGALLAVGSRYVPGGGAEKWPFKRRAVSRLACWPAKCLTGVKDATSGFFALRRQVLEGIQINPPGFKIGLEIIVKGRHDGKIVEVPYVFTGRRYGRSKFGPSIIFLYIRQLMGLIFYRGKLRP